MEKILKDGDVVRNYGKEFIARNVKIGPLTKGGEQVYYYSGECTKSPCNDDIRKTCYNGGTYSWRASDK